MAIITYPLNNVNYSATDAELYNSTRTSGVFSTNENLDCSIIGNRTIRISPGLAWIKNSAFSGKAVGVTESVDLTFDVAENLLDRIDRVVLRFSANENASNIIILKGSPSSNPTAVERSTTESVYDLVLYDVLIRYGSVSIITSDITDQRANMFLCGLMRDGVTREDEYIDDAIVTALNSASFRANQITSGTLPISRGGTGSSTKSDAQKALGIQHGSLSITIPANSSTASATVNFSPTFNSTPHVVATVYSTLSADKMKSTAIGNVSTTGVTIYLHSANKPTSNYTATVHWIAIG